MSYVKKDRKEIELSIEEQEKAEKNVEKFLKEFLEKTQKDAKYSIEKTSSGLKVNINNENRVLQNSKGNLQGKHRKETRTYRACKGNEGQ